LRTWGNKSHAYELNRHNTSLAIIPAVLLCGKLTQYVNKKILLAIGAIIFAIGGAVMSMATESPLFLSLARLSCWRRVWCPSCDRIYPRFL
jgi:hypothetical protein